MVAKSSEINSCCSARICFNTEKSTDKCICFNRSIKPLADASKGELTFVKWAQDYVDRHPECKSTGITKVPFAHIKAVGKQTGQDKSQTNTVSVISDVTDSDAFNNWMRSLEVDSVQVVTETTETDDSSLNWGGASAQSHFPVNANRDSSDSASATDNCYRSEDCTLMRGGNSEVASSVSDSAPTSEKWSQAIVSYVEQLEACGAHQLIPTNQNSISDFDILASQFDPDNQSSDCQADALISKSGSGSETLDTRFPKPDSEPETITSGNVLASIFEEFVSKPNPECVNEKASVELAHKLTLEESKLFNGVASVRYWDKWRHNCGLPSRFDMLRTQAFTPEVYEGWLEKRLREKKAEPLPPKLGWQFFTEPGESRPKWSSYKRLHAELSTTVSKRKEVPTDEPTSRSKAKSVAMQSTPSAAGSSTDSQSTKRIHCDFCSTYHKSDEVCAGMLGMHPRVPDPDFSGDCCLSHHSVVCYCDRDNYYDLLNKRRKRFVTAGGSAELYRDGNITSSLMAFVIDGPTIYPVPTEDAVLVTTLDVVAPTTSRRTKSSVPISAAHNSELQAEIEAEDAETMSGMITESELLDVITNSRNEKAELPSSNSSASSSPDSPLPTFEATSLLDAFRTTVLRSSGLVDYLASNNGSGLSTGPAAAVLGLSPHKLASTFSKQQLSMQAVQEQLSKFESSPFFSAITITLTRYCSLFQDIILQNDTLNLLLKVLGVGSLVKIAAPDVFTRFTNQLFGLLAKAASKGVHVFVSTVSTLARKFLAADLEPYLQKQIEQNTPHTDSNSSTIALPVVATVTDGTSTIGTVTPEALTACSTIPAGAVLRRTPSPRPLRLGELAS